MYWLTEGMWEDTKTIILWPTEILVEQGKKKEERSWLLSPLPDSCPNHCFPAEMTMCGNMCVVLKVDGQNGVP